MQTTIRIIVALLVVGMVVLQFFQPEKNAGEINGNHIFKVEQLPENIKTAFENACMDCHSNQTKYLWYHKIAPVSFMINKHIVDGKKELNFSEWGELDGFGKIGVLDEISHETERKTMPLKPYVLMHRKAKLTDEQISAIISWSQTLSEKIVADFEGE